MRCGSSALNWVQQRVEEREANPIGENVGRPCFSRTDRLALALRLSRIITSSPRPQGYEELARILGVSRRTLFRDLSLLREVGFESPHAQQRRGFRTGQVSELLGPTLTLREVAAILELLEHDHQPKPDSAYDRVLREAKQKIILALRGECSVILTKLEAEISTLRNE